MGFEPTTLCLGIHSSPVPLPSTHVRPVLFDRAGDDLAFVRAFTVVRLCSSAWLQFGYSAWYLSRNRVGKRGTP